MDLAATTVLNNNNINNNESTDSVVKSSSPTTLVLLSFRQALYFFYLFLFVFSFLFLSIRHIAMADVAGFIEDYVTFSDASTVPVFRLKDLTEMYIKSRWFCMVHLLKKLRQYMLPASREKS